jgi:hypothetical protein
LPDAFSSSLAFAWRASFVEPLDRQELWAFLEHVALAAAGEAESLAGHLSLLCYRDNDAADVRIRRFAPLGRARALDYLATLCRELLRAEVEPGMGLHPYLLPYEAVMTSRAGGTSVTQEIRGLCQRCRRAGTGFSSTLGPLPDVVDTYPIPSQGEAERMVEARFGLLFDLVGKLTP